MRLLVRDGLAAGGHSRWSLRRAARACRAGSRGGPSRWLRSPSANPLRPDSGAERACGRIDAADPGDHEVGMREVEARVQARAPLPTPRRAPCLCRSAGQRTPVEQVQAQIVVALREDQDGRPRCSFSTQLLVLAGRVTGIGALLKHVEDDNLDLDGLVLGRDEAARAGRGRHDSRRRQR